MPRTFEGYRYKEQMEAIALLEVDEKDRESYYIRTAMDNMRRITMRQKRGEKTRRGKYEEISYRLAYYAKTIKHLYANREKKFDNNSQFKILVFELSKDINDGREIKRNNQLLPPEEVDNAIENIANELRERLNNSIDYDPIETVVLIEYRMHYAKCFFDGAHRGIAEALAFFFLIRETLRLPEYTEISKFENIFEKLPSRDDPNANILEINKNISILREEQAFRDWINVYSAQFTPPSQLEIPFVRPSDPWKVQDINAMDTESTSYNENYVTRKPKDIDRLRRATGMPTEDIVVFRPERMALHETIAAAVTKIQLVDPPEDLHSLVVDANGLFRRSILPQIIEICTSEKFNDDKELFDDYVKYSMDDYFNIVNPNMEMRIVLTKAKRAIIRRIRDGSFDPRLIESRHVMHDLVSDELLRTHYQRQIRKTVDIQIEAYLVSSDSKKSIRLPLKPNSQRIAWVLAGGIAAGKTTLERLILSEYANFVHSNDSLCQINSDHYKTLLMHKSHEDPGHGSKTRSEGLRVRDLILDRLKEMIEANFAPDFLISTVAPVPKRMSLAGEGGAKVNLYMLSCPADGSNGSVQRAFRRANDKKNSDAYNRFVSTKRVLESHRTASRSLPLAIAEKRRDLRIFNSAAEPTTLIASMDSHNRELRLFDPNAFLGFVKKTFINEDAQAETELYPNGGVSPSALAAVFCDYCTLPKPGVSFNFRYSDMVPNLKSESLHNLVVEKSAEGNENASRNSILLIASQIETYAWIGHERAEIHDILTFINALGGVMAEALLTELSNRWSLKVRDYIGNILFVSENSNKVVDYDPQRVQDNELRGILDRIALSFRRRTLSD